MDTEKAIKKILTRNKRQWGQRDKGDWFEYNGQPSEEYELTMELLPELLNGQYSVSIYSLLFEGLSYWNLLNSQYQRLCKDDKAAQTEHFAQAALHGFLAVESNHRTVQNYLFNKVAMAMALNMIACWNEQADLIGDNMVESINNDRDDMYMEQKIRRNIIGTGRETRAVSWFLLDLHCKYHGTGFNEEAAQRFDPDYYLIYTDALAHWNSTDLNQIDQHVYKLLDFHLERALAGSDEVGGSATNIFPYEIHAWMAYRTRAGLENPSTFSHPMMNQPLGEPIDGERPLAKPHIEWLEPLLKKYEEEEPGEPKVMDLLDYMGPSSNG